MIVAVLVGLILGERQISLELPATPVDGVLKRIAAVSGEDLKVDDSLKDRFLLLSVKDVPVKELKEQIAKALQAEWVKVSGSQFLRPEARHGITGYARSVHDYFSKQKVEPFTEAEGEKLIKDSLALSRVNEQTADFWEKQNALVGRSLGSWFKKRVVQAIGEEAVVSLRKGQRIVYSTAPTKMQKPLPSTVQPIVAEFERQARSYGEALERLTAGEHDRGKLYLPTLGQPWLPESGFQSMTVAVTRGSYDVRFMITLTADNNEGTSSFESTLFLDPLGEIKPQQVAGLETEYKPSSDAEAVNRLFFNPGLSSTSDAPVRVDTSHRAQEIFCDLNQNELLALSPSEILLQTAHSLGKDVVAAVPDRAVYLDMFVASQSKWKLTDLFNACLQSSLFHLVDEGKTWLLSFPADDSIPGFSLPRRSVSTFVKDALAHGANLDNLADLVAATQDDDEVVPVLTIALAPLGDSIEEVGSSEGQDALRLYGHLTPNQRALAARGGVTIPVRALPRVMSDLVVKSVFVDHPLLSQGTVDLDPIRRGTERSGQNEVTTLLPDGLPLGASVRFLVRDLSTLFACHSGAGEARATLQPVTVETVANGEAWRRYRAELDPSESDTKFCVGTMKQLDVVIDLGSERYVQLRYQLHPKVARKDLVGVDGLPMDVKGSINKRAAELVEAWKKANLSRLGGPGNTIPPPSR